MHHLKLVSALLFLSLFTVVQSQNSFIRGTVFDNGLGEPLMGVAIVVDGTTKGTVTDLDGKFSLTMAPGKYTLKVSFISFETMVLNDIQVIANEVTLLENLRLKEATMGLGEVVITASMVRNTETSMLTMKMKSVNVLDGISAVSFKKIGDSDAASSMKRVTGVSVEGGKYVYVRGLGDRYTKTIVNGVDIPGLDPDRNTMQLDIFPTNLIDNIIIHKSFSAELPADFTGGVIDIAVKDFPEQRKGSFSTSAGYNPDFHFRNNYLTYEGGKTDWLGFDDGTRAIPAKENIPFFSDVAGKPLTNDESIRYRKILESFNPTMSATKQMSFMDYSFGTTIGDQFAVKNVTLGYNFGLSYSSNTEFYKDAEYGRYGLSGDPDITEMEVREFQKGDFGVSSVLLSGLAGIALKTKSSKFRLNFLHLQNGESKAGYFNYESSDLGTIFSGIQHNLEYSQRSLTNILLDGKHSFKGPKLDVVWKFSPTISKIEDPDARFTRYVTSSGGFKIGTESGFPERIWRELSEINLAGVLHISKDFKFNREAAKLNLGGAYTYKQRDFMINKYSLNIRDLPPLTGDPNELFYENNLWPLNGTETNKGTTYEANFIPSNPNQFDANSRNVAGYISAEMTIFKNLRAIIGVRAEDFVQRYTGIDQLRTNILENDIVLNAFDLFPSVNMVFSITERQNIRFSYAKTIARPSFKEMSYAEIFDPISNRTFIGGFWREADDVKGTVYWAGKLKSTYIHNFDLRWELFQTKNQMISVSGFFKTFDKPIEIVQFATTQKGSFQPRNVGDGQVLGVETELRQNLDFLGDKWKKFSFNANISVTRSIIEMSLTEYNSRIENARTGQTIERNREMAGQSPYIINLGLSYNGGEEGFWHGFEAGFYYNVQGTTLQYVGIADRPDIYMLPFHSLNFNTSKFLGKNKKTQIGFKIDNLLNDEKESVFRSFNPTDQFFTRLEPGITFQFRLGYTFF